MSDDSLRKLGFILLGISAIVLLAYPMVLIANIMSLGGYKKPDTTFMQLLPSRIFILVTTLYPLTVWLSYRNFKKDYNITFATLPYIHLIVIIIAYFIWASAE